MPTFTGPKVKTTRKGECPTCGKPTTRTQTFEGTVNPFNKRPDGVVKTWSEVATDVRAKADAWEPDPAIFEHAACEAQRLAPTPAEPVALAAADAEQAATVRLLMADVILWLEATGLPCPEVSVGLDHLGRPVAKVESFLPAHHLPMWARALGLDSVQVDEHGASIYVRMRSEVRGMSWSVDGSAPIPEVGDRLGGADVKWSRDRRTGRKTGYGTVTVAELEAGLLRMGVAVVSS